MSITPTFVLSDGSNTVRLEWDEAAEEFKNPTEIVPYQIRRKIGSKTEPGLVQLLTDKWQKSGQTKTTRHRFVSPTNHFQLRTWNRTKEVLTYNDGAETHNVVILKYDADPKTVLFRHSERYKINEITLMYREDT